MRKPNKYWPPEFYDDDQVLENGAKKYTPDGWLNNVDSPTMSGNQNHDKVFHHLARSFVYKENYKTLLSLVQGLVDAKQEVSEVESSHPKVFSVFENVVELVSSLIMDKESGLDHLLHARCRLGMEYTRKKRGMWLKELLSNEEVDDDVNDS